MLEASLPPPLYSPHGNSVNRDFFSLVVIAFNAILGVSGLYQLLQIVFAKEYGPHKIKYAFGSSWKSNSSGISQQFRLVTVIIQTLAFAFLAVLNFGWNLQFLSLALSAITTGVIFFSLQIYEPTKSTVQLGSVLFFWFGKLFLDLFATVQDSVSSHYIFASSPLGITTEIIITLATVYVFISEVNFWKPTVELKEYFELNEWRLDTTRNIFADLTTTWPQPIIAEIYRSDEIEFDTLPPLPEELDAETTSIKLQRIWDDAVISAKQKQQKQIRKLSKQQNKQDSEIEVPPLKVSLFIPLVKAFSGLIVIVVLADLLEIFISYSQPFLLQWFISYFTEAIGTVRIFSEDGKHTPPPKIIGFFLASLIYVTSVFRYFLSNQLHLWHFRLNNSYIASLRPMIYNKAIRLTPEARKDKSAGDIVNNFTMDVSVVSSYCSSLQNFIFTPIKLVLCILSLHKLIGSATYGGLLTIAALTPLASLVSASIISLYPLLMKHKDERLSLISEILNSIKSVKLYSWEKPMLARLRGIRNDNELRTLKKIGIVTALSTFLWQSIPFFVSGASYATFVWLYDIPLTPEIVFPALSLFDMLTGPIYSLPHLFSKFIKGSTSIGRLHELLLMEELDLTFITKSEERIKPGDVSVSINDGTFVWSKKKQEELKIDEHRSVPDEEEAVENVTDPDSENALTDINFIAKKGKLTCVLGKIGSGKTTLFKALLGEVPLAESSIGKTKVEISGTVAYCSQSPWILNGTVKENILFGCKYNKDFYLKTIDACELVTDFKVLPDGDKTVVGEKGISLSGGQKARIALARAVYSRSDIYFLDDVLSAVDAHVGKNIIEKVLGPKGIISTKTRVLATNSVPVLHEADLIYMLKSGKFIETGDFEEVMNRGGDLAALITEFGRRDNEKPDIQEESEESEASEDTEVLAPTPVVDVVDEVIAEGDEVTLKRVISNGTIGKASLTSYSHVFEDEDEDDGKKKKTGNSAEETVKGRINLSIFLEYFRACNYAWVAVYVLLSLLKMVLKVGENAVLTQWSEKNAAAGETVNLHYFLSLYISFGVAGGFLNLLAAFVLWSLCIIRGASYFHDTMATSILRSPMRFFETTPVGRILNRFTDDINTIDMYLPWTFRILISNILNGVVTFSVICYHLPMMTVLLAFLLVLYDQIRKYYIPCAREMRRLYSKSKSPQFSHIQETINGIDTVKAYDQTARFIHKNKQNIDNVTRIAFMAQVSSMWLSMWLQSISSILIYATALLSLLTIGGHNEISPSLLGFIMVYALSITNILNIMVSVWAEVETQTVAVERLVEYCHLMPEAAEVVEDNRPPLEWPAHGEIKFVNYSTRYAENLDNVLKNINICIKSNEKIGIVGRTGAGKSSLTMALFRLIESTSGHIVIDGIDTSKIGLSDLRNQLGIIPQDAQTVAGSVRQNLDPIQKHTDEQLWRVLELAHLKEHVKSMKTEPTDKEKNEHKGSKVALKTKYELDAKIFEGGSNLSAGQMQLLCLARALLNPSRILLLDEATAAVDVQTDKIIQETIRAEFKDKTILVIAHRLETIMDSDRILVLDDGEVKEFDTPENLLKDKNGIFYLLAKEAGQLSTWN